MNYFIVWISRNELTIDEQSFDNVKVLPVSDLSMVTYTIDQLNKCGVDSNSIYVFKRSDSTYLNPHPNKYNGTVFCRPIIFYEFSMKLTYI